MKWMLTKSCQKVILWYWLRRKVKIRQVTECLVTGCLARDLVRNRAETKQSMVWPSNWLLSFYNFLYNILSMETLSFTMWRHWWDLLTWNREYNINPYHSWPHPSTTSRQTGSEVVGHLVTPQVRQLGLVVGVKTAVFLPCQPKRLPLITALDIRQFKSFSRFPLTSMTNKPLGSRKYPPTESNRILVSMLTWIFIAKSTKYKEKKDRKRSENYLLPWH